MPGRVFGERLLCMRCHKNKVTSVDAFCYPCREKMNAMAALRTQLNPIDTNLYAISARDVPDAQIKLGYSQSIGSRLSGLQTGSPVPLIVLASCPGLRQHEKMVHRHLKEFRRSGEWFERGEKVLACVEMMKAGTLLKFLGAEMPDVSLPLIRDLRKQSA